eukprot:Nitzschia sp. Nitz4//scaffold230_size58257//36396//37061//NITZ4_006485-RA/size58257-processed-gene-0.101-mRNA-1//-1//CDS//3329543262//8300//frame0
MMLRPGTPENQAAIHYQCPLDYRIRDSSGKHVLASSPNAFEMVGSANLSNKKRRSKAKKQVRFNLESSQVDSNRVCLTQEECESMWFGRSTKKQALSEATVFRESPKGSMDVDSRSYLACFKEALSTCHSDNKLEHLPPVSGDTSARGLEPLIFPEMVKIRRRATQMVLKAQERFPPGANRDQRAALLGSVSKSLSKPSRRMARILAVGDAKVVANDLQMS